jgi:hypothetical protein
VRCEIMRGGISKKSRSFKQSSGEDACVSFRYTIPLSRIMPNVPPATRGNGNEFRRVLSQLLRRMEHVFSHERFRMRGSERSKIAFVDSREMRSLHREGKSSEKSIDSNEREGAKPRRMDIYAFMLNFDTKTRPIRTIKSF